MHNQQEWVFRGELPVCSIVSLPLQGRHNMLNCMAAMALVEPWLEPVAAANYYARISKALPTDLKR